MPSPESKAGFLEAFRFPDVERKSLIAAFKDARADRFVAAAENRVAIQNLVADLAAGEPSRAELRKELDELARFFASIEARCLTMSAAAAASIHAQGGAAGSQFLDIGQYFLGQSGAAARAAESVKKGAGRDRDSNGYIDMLVNLVRAHRVIFGSDLKSSRGTAAHTLACSALAAAGVHLSGKQVETALRRAKLLVAAAPPIN